MPNNSLGAQTEPTFPKQGLKEERVYQQLSELHWHTPWCLCTACVNLCAVTRRRCGAAGRFLCVQSTSFFCNNPFTIASMVCACRPTRLSALHVRPSGLVSLPPLNTLFTYSTTSQAPLFARASSSNTRDQGLVLVFCN